MWPSESSSNSVRSKEIPSGGVTEVRIPTAGKWFAQNAQLELNGAPEGIVLRGVSVEDATLVVALGSDKGAAKVGRKGNIILYAYRERTVPAPDGKKREITRRFPMGVLPAIPYAVVDVAPGS